MKVIVIVIVTIIHIMIIIMIIITIMIMIIMIMMIAAWGTTCLTLYLPNTCLLQRWRIMQQINSAVLDK